MRGTYPDVLHLGGGREPFRVALVEVSAVVEDIGVVHQPLFVALEVNIVNLVETRQGREHPDVREGNAVSCQVASRRKNHLQPAYAAKRSV